MKSRFSEKVNKIVKPLARPTKKRKEKNPKKIKNEKEVTMDTTEIQKNHKRILSTVIRQKVDNLQEMNNFLETYKLPKLNSEETDQLNRPLTRNEIKCHKTTPYKLKLGPDGFKGEFYQTYKEKHIPTLLKLFQKVEEEGTLPKIFYEATVTLIPKPDKALPKIKL